MEAKLPGTQNNNGDDPLVVGLVGSFGSGCSTLAEALQNKGFQVFSLTNLLRQQWTPSDSEGDPLQLPTRQELQDLGDELRRVNGWGYLAECAAKSAENAQSPDKIVFDSIKNLGEVNYFRRRYRNFFLVAVQCSTQVRWSRVKARYDQQNLGEDALKRDDLRDQLGLDLPYGQQVQTCVDDADIVISNQEKCHSRPEAVRSLNTRFEPYLNLMTAESRHYPSLDEVMMAIAYIRATYSRCIKRQVGAVIVDDQDNIVASSFNENPPPLQPCADRHICEKESRMVGQIEALEKCPRCGQPITGSNPSYVCPACRCSFKEVLFPDRGMQWCPSIHAEDSAIRQAPRSSLAGCTLFTTTFPCFNCAKAIVYSGIRRVVYVEPYPEVQAAELLEEVRCDVLLFEGVKARAFHRLFAPIQHEMESRYGMAI